MCPELYKRTVVYKSTFAQKNVSCIINVLMKWREIKMLLQKVFVPIVGFGHFCGWREKSKIYSIKSVQAQWGQNIFQIVFEYYNFTNILAFTHQIGEIISRYQITL